MHAGTKSQNLTVDSMIFGCGQKWLWPFLMRHWDLLYFKNKFMNWADFLNAADDAIIFG